jgi:hypothetical protein
MKSQAPDFVDIVDLWRLVRDAERRGVSPDQLPHVRRAMLTLARTVDRQMVENQKEDLSVRYPDFGSLSLDLEPTAVELPPSNFKEDDPLA